MESCAFKPSDGYVVVLSGKALYSSFSCLVALMLVEMHHASSHKRS